MVVWHLIHRQRRPLCRYPKGYRDFRSLLRRSSFTVSLPTEAGAGEPTRRLCEPAGKREMKGVRRDGARLGTDRRKGR